MQYNQEELRTIADVMAASAYTHKPQSTALLLKMLERMDDATRRETLRAFENGRSIRLSKHETDVLVDTWKLFRTVLIDNGYGNIVYTGQEGPCFRRMAYTAYEIHRDKNTTEKLVGNSITIQLTPYIKEETSIMSCNSCPSKIEIINLNAPVFQATTVTYVTFGGIEGRNVKGLTPAEIQRALEATEQKLDALRAIPEPRPNIINKQIDELVGARNQFVALVDEAFKE